MTKSAEIQNGYNIIKFLAENGFPDFINAAERLGQVAEQQRKKESLNNRLCFRFVDKPLLTLAERF